jgi:hypothetical protein
VVGVVTGVAVGTLSGVLGLVLELFKERRSGLLESRNAVYSDYLAALAQWANLLSEVAEATDAATSWSISSLRKPASDSSLPGM